VEFDKVNTARARVFDCRRDNRYQLLQMNPRDAIVLWAEADDQCDKLAVDSCSLRVSDKVRRLWSGPCSGIWHLADRRRTGASEVTTLWRYTNLFIIIIFLTPVGLLNSQGMKKLRYAQYKKSTKIS